MVSASQGADFMLLTKHDFDSLPFPSVESPEPPAKAELLALADRLQGGDEGVWEELDAFVFNLYGIDSDFIQVIRDTLYSSGSYRNASKASHEPTAATDRREFSETLRSELNPYFDVFGERVTVRDAEFESRPWDEPWRFLAVSRESKMLVPDSALLQKAMEVANQRGCSRVVINAPDGEGLLVGLLNRRRWWTHTRARLCAQYIIREQLEAFGLPGSL
jgi:hypothetical protein